MKTHYRFLNLCLFILLTAGTLFAQAPRTFSYQGLLLNAAKTPVTGVHLITVKLYDSASGGTTLHTENFSTQVERGVFSVIIGSQVILDSNIKFDKQYWLGVSVGDAAEMTPRTMLTSVPYANTIGNLGSGLQPQSNVVHSITGTANQVLANGKSGSKQRDDVTLTLPQDIHSSASPTFVNLTLTGKGTSAETRSTDFSPTLTTKGYVDDRDGINTAAINAEANRAVGAENTLSIYINDEINRAQAGEGTLTTNLATEVTRAMTAEGNKWALGGNSSPSSNVFGTTSATDVLMYAGNTQQMNLRASGGINIPATASSGIGAVYQNGSLLLHTYRGKNLFVGTNAGNLTTTGTLVPLPDDRPGEPDSLSVGEGYNTGIGYNAMSSITTGTRNTGVGTKAMMSNTTGDFNTALGTEAMEFNTIGYRNTGLGIGALRWNTSGFRNTAIGFAANARQHTGSNNTAVGAAALVYDSAGSNNVGVGFSALRNDNAANNTAVGYQSMLNNVAGNNNTVAGWDVLSNNTSGSQNVAMGYNAGLSNTTESNNTFLGYLSNGAAGITNATALGANAVVGASNTIQLGSSAVMNVITNGSLTTTAGGIHIPTTTAAGAGVVFQNGIRYIHSYQTHNFFAGQNAGNFTMTGSDIGFTSVNDGQVIAIGDGGNTAVGDSALSSNTTGFNNTAIGRLSMTKNTTGFANTAVGQHSLWTNTTGMRNTAVGISSLNFNTTGAHNTALGFQTLTHNTTGDSSTAVGSAVLNFSTTGRRNTGVGFKALNTSTTAADNTAMGLRSLFSTTIGERNTAMGGLSLLNNTTGAQNVAMGYNAGLSNTTGNANTFIGYSANGAAGITNATAIGANASVSQSNAVVLGSSADVGIRTSTPRAELDINSTGSIIVPVGTTAQQPVAPVQGMIRFNTTTNHFEGYNGTAWNNLD